jgi:hypothetical protein
LRIEANGPSIDISERFEQQRFAFHNGDGSVSADVAKPQHG